jgi:hypothetical protein
MICLTYRYILLFLICLLPTFCFGQVAYDGEVINSVTDIAIQGVTVTLLKEKTGTQTNENGYFSLESERPAKNDTLQFTCVGYKPFKLPISAYLPHVLIALQASNTQLNEVVINNKKVKTIKLGRFSYYDIHSTAQHQVMLIKQRTPLAKLFTAPKANAILIDIAIGRMDLPTSPSFAIRNKFTTFLIHVMAEDPATGGPGKILFTKNASLTDNSTWIDFDVSKDYIIIPTAKFFLAVEWLINPYNEIIGVSNSPKLDWITKRGYQMLKDASEYRVYYQPFLVGYGNEDTLIPAVLYNKVGSSWQYTQQYEPLDLALSATIHY